MTAESSRARTSGEESKDELALVRRAATDTEAFGALYEQHVRRIYNYIYYRTGNHHDAEDLTARVFQRALRHVGRYQDKGVPFSAWLYRIAHNLVANWHRDRSRRPIVPLEDHVLPSAPGSLPEAAALASEEQRVLLEAVRRLPEERQQLLILKFVERLSNAEIGVIMGRTEGAIKSLYHRTLNTLRDDLTGLPESQEDGDDGGESPQTG
ncbi:MAG TPA: sigma-70 family RNA polymerase sigma factor [Anaerolineales bacterium]|nr:sigma-70 family RNA polymerase sigma factor [Anaerolineales bacterium]